MIEPERPSLPPEAAADAAPVFAPPVFAPPPPAALVMDTSAAEALAHAASIRRAANWLLAIALLSAVNVALAVAGSDHSFAVGLFVSQFVATVGAMIAADAHAHWVSLAGAVVATVPALAFVALSYPARKGRAWAFVVALVAYGLDLLLLIVLVGAGDLLGAGIHVWAMFAMLRGWSSASERKP